jgi:putative secretion ATPase (PEP-CTERM system associated)
MYAEFYHLTGKPFQLTPDPRFYFDSSTHKKAMAYLTYGLSQGEGFIIVTGDIGAGKTTLVGHLFDGLDRDQYVAAKVVTTQLGADDILRMVASGFGIPSEDADKAALLQRIERFLRLQHDRGKRALLIVDEVQNLPTDSLEELRMLSNFQVGERALLQSFLLGQPEFRDKWATDPNLEQLRQRVIAIHHLSAMTRDEIRGYILHRLQLVGWNNDPVFTESAYQKIFDFTGGVPRKVNTLCSRLLLYGAIEELHEINEGVVDAVVADLEKDNQAGFKRNAEALEAAQRLKDKAGQDSAILKEMEGRAQAANLQIDLADMLSRLEVVEQYVRVHEQTIKEALDIASQWLENPENTHEA